MAKYAAYGTVLSVGTAQVETALVLVAEPVLVQGGKIPVNTAFNPVALGVDLDGFGDRHGPIGVDGDIAVVVQDLFTRPG